jgi:hypothetical protein
MFLRLRPNLLSKEAMANGGSGTQIDFLRAVTRSVEYGRSIIHSVVTGCTVDDLNDSLRSPSTSAEAAARAGVSRTTVSFVLNGVRNRGISEATRDRVLAVARELGYAPNAAARQLATAGHAGRAACARAGRAAVLRIRRADSPALIRPAGWGLSTLTYPKRFRQNESHQIT